jgi:hypothetical protein
MAASHLTSSLLAEALVRWQHAAGPFWPYVCAAPFLGTGEGETMARQAWTRHQRFVCPGTAPSSHHDLHPSRGHTELVGRLLNAARAVQDPPGLPLSIATGRDVGAADESYEQRSGGEGSSVLLVDLPAEPLLAAAPLLVEHGWYVVPIVQRWIASPAILPCRRLVERLVVGARRARRPTAPRGAVLIADGERMGPVGRPATVPGRAFDNRYEYQICRFPSTDFLKAQGVDRVHWISTGTRAADRPVRPDLAPYLEDLLRAGLTVDVLPWPAPA